MSDKKNIDRLFQEKFKDFEVTPGPSVWGNITKEISAHNKHRKSVFLWRKIAAVAAGLLLLFSIGSIVLNNDENTPEPTIVNTDSETPIQDNTNQKKTTKIDSLETQEVVDEDATKEQIPNSNNIINNKSKNTISNISRQQSKLASVKPVPKVNIQKNDIKTASDKVLEKKNNTNAIANNREAIAEVVDKTGKDLNNKGHVKTTSEVANTTQKDEVAEDSGLSMSEAIAQSDDVETDKDEVPNVKKWSVTPKIAPVYFNSLGTGSSLHEQFNSNSKSGAVNMSYGVSASYAINNKLSVRTGIHNVNLGYSTNDIVVYNNLQSAPNNDLMRNVKLSKEGQLLSFISAEEFNYAQVPGVISNHIDAAIDQDLSFLEIPIEIQYKLSDSKFGINIVGGFSALFLNNNNIYSVQGGKSTLLGKATNINNMSYSANLGLGLDYKVSEKINLNLEPMFKYQLNTFNNTSGNFKPYFIGIYSGFSFKF